MSLDNKAQWLADLRSGNYKRCDPFRTGTKEPYSYCPLGLLAKINGFDFVPIMPSKMGTGAFLPDFDHQVTDSYRWPKKYDQNWPNISKALKIIDMNSLKERGKPVYTWLQIADWIEENVS